MAFIRVGKKLIVVTICYKFRDTKLIKKHIINIKSISTEDVNPINFKHFGDFITLFKISKQKLYLYLMFF